MRLVPIPRHLPRHRHHRRKPYKAMNRQPHFLDRVAGLVEGGEAARVRCYEDHLDFFVFAADVVDYELEFGFAVSRADYCFCACCCEGVGCCGG